MEKIIIFVFTFLLCPLFCSAQEVQNFEGEAYFGFTHPLSGFHNGDKLFGPELGLELRYNIPHTNWDCGVLLDASTAVYEFEEVAFKSDCVMEQSNRSVNFVLVGDYNFRQGAKVNPYVGAGIGLSSYEAIEDVVYKRSGNSFVFRPRAGVELFRHLRVGLDLNLNRKGFHNLGITIGGVIGGRPK